MPLFIIPDNISVRMVQRKTLSIELKITCLIEHAEFLHTIFALSLIVSWLKFNLAFHFLKNLTYWCTKHLIKSYCKTFLSGCKANEIYQLHPVPLPSPRPVRYHSS